MTNMIILKEKLYATVQVGLQFVLKKKRHTQKQKKIIKKPLFFLHNNMSPDSSVNLECTFFIKFQLCVIVGGREGNSIN